MNVQCFWGQMGGGGFGGREGKWNVDDQTMQDKAGHGQLALLHAYMHC